MNLLVLSTMNKKKIDLKFYIETFGCQMNKYDSELVASILTDMGYEEATKKSDATLLLVNTCSVRETAESRALGRLSALNKQKLKNPNVIIGLLGCMAQRIGPQILEKKPFVNFALGPDDYRQLPDILKKVGRGTQRQQEFKIDVTDFEDYANIYPLRVHGVSAWVAIMRGCNNFCTYCIVPYLRGRERSRRLDNILEEVKNLTADGFKEVTLLGQNVNSYLDENTDFPELLRHVCRIDGIERIRFASSHPKDFSPELIQVMAEEPKVCNHIHLALQAGSNRVLKRMQRNYTREHFLSLLTAAREQVPGISFTTDVIVGFPGETDADFEETLSLVKEARFDNAFTFKFNPREGTQAASMTDDVSAEEKQRRLEALIVLQNEITLQQNKNDVGKIMPVLVEGPSKKRVEQYMGRTDTNKIVIFPSTTLKQGDIVQVKITETAGHTLFGDPILS